MARVATASPAGEVRTRWAPPFPGEEVRTRRTITLEPVPEPARITRTVRIERRRAAGLPLLWLLLLFLLFGIIAAVLVTARPGPATTPPSVPGPTPPGLTGRPAGGAPVAVSQALLVDEPRFSAAQIPDTDMPPLIFSRTSWIATPIRSFGGASDDFTTFRAAMELAAGDWAQIELPIKNASKEEVYALLTLRVPPQLNAYVWADKDTADISDVTQVGPNQWVFKVGKAANYGNDVLRIVVNAHDAVPPGYFIIDAVIEQIEV